MSEQPLTEIVAEFLHERFAAEWEEHWRDLDADERRESRYWDMSVALTREAVGFTVIPATEVTP